MTPSNRIVPGRDFHRGNFAPSARLFPCQFLSLPRMLWDLLPFAAPRIWKIKCIEVRAVNYAWIEVA